MWEKKLRSELPRYILSCRYWNCPTAADPLVESSVWRAVNPGLAGKGQKYPHLKRSRIQNRPTEADISVILSNFTADLNIGLN